MKALSWLAASLLLGLPVAHAQQVLAHASSTAPPPGSALPPPGIDDSGAQAVPLPSTGIPPSVAPAARERNGHGDSTNVAVRTNDAGDTIQEYSRNGSVYMVRVTPKHGVTQTYIVNPAGSNRMHDPRLGPVSPVYYDIYKWGKPRKPASAESGAAPPQPPSSSR